MLSPSGLKAAILIGELLWNSDATSAPLSVSHNRIDLSAEEEMSLDPDESKNTAEMPNVWPR